ncbi:hypothetical protein GIB67_019141 [Kingdonia uniflora]|uniref:Uncharacterized protein n=1 Tax=Kingdonia uniflora TaxID=39325 RepID=A0A7J7N050_9MAGN|nr:hypothetical protein GIB67_019141 [Kingdonia uniflora]
MIPRTRSASSELCDSCPCKVYRRISRFHDEVQWMLSLHGLQLGVSQGLKKRCILTLHKWYLFLKIELTLHTIILATENLFQWMIWF